MKKNNQLTSKAFLKSEYIETQPHDLLYARDLNIKTKRFYNYVVWTFSVVSDILGRLYATSSKYLQLLACPMLQQVKSQSVRKYHN